MAPRPSPPDHPVSATDDRRSPPAAPLQTPEAARSPARSQPLAACSSRPANPPPPAAGSPLRFLRRPSRAQLVQLRHQIRPRRIVATHPRKPGADTSDRPVDLTPRAALQVLRDRMRKRVCDLSRTSRTTIDSADRQKIRRRITRRRNLRDDLPRIRRRMHQIRRNRRHRTSRHQLRNRCHIRRRKASSTSPTTATNSPSPH